jgi:serine/threonine-protein kinase
VKRPVALKLLHTGFYSSELLARFARERDILAALAHANIARLYDAGFTATGQPFLALEFVEGLALTEYCDRKRLDVRERLQLMLQVLTAVQYAHSHLVVHRDLKPSNILVTADGRVQLLDFGIAKLLADELGADTQLTQLGARALTPDYASPEQVTGKPLTTATDIYSLGVIFYELLTGARPYRLKHDTLRALEEAILEGAPPKPSRAPNIELRAQHRGTTGRRLVRILRGDLDTIALKVLSKEPERRYASADAFAQDLVRFTHGDAVLAQPNSAWYRARKFLGRNKLTAVSALAVVVALASGLGIALWQADKAREHAHRAETQAQIATAVQTFMLNLFHTNSIEQPDPIKAQQTTARELLDLGASQIERDLKDAPEARLRALKMLADTYTELRMTEKAVALGHERIAVARSLYGADGPEVAYALIDLSDNLQTSKAVSERAAVLREATRILDLHQENGSNARGRLLRQLAQSSVDHEPARSLEYIDQAVALYRERHEPIEVVRSLVAGAPYRSVSGICVALLRHSLTQPRCATAYGPSVQARCPNFSAIWATSARNRATSPRRKRPIGVLLAARSRTAVPIMQTPFRLSSDWVPCCLTRHARPRACRRSEARSITQFAEGCGRELPRAIRADRVWLSPDADGDPRGGARRCPRGGVSLSKVPPD